MPFSKFYFYIIFVSLTTLSCSIKIPEDVSKEIRENLQWQEEGWGRMKASANVNGFEWDTAIWFDKKLDTYLLPLKVDIRKKASLNLNDMISVRISI